MKTKMLGILLSTTLVACGGGGGGSTAAPAATQPSVSASSVSNPVSPAPTQNAADLALAGRLYKGDERTPTGFDVEARPASVAGILSTRHLKNTDLATGPQSAGPMFEMCTNDLAQALEWSERLATWGGQYSDLGEVRSTAQMFEINRVPRADATALLRHRVFKCDYLDRSGSDLREDTGSAGAMNQRPLTATELEVLAEYLWQFTLFNNADYVVESSTRTGDAQQLLHTIRMGQMVRGANGSCDTVQVSDWVHRMNTSTGALTRSFTPVRSFRVKNVVGSAERCEN